MIRKPGLAMTAGLLGLGWIVACGTPAFCARRKSIA